MGEMGTLNSLLVIGNSVGVLVRQASDSLELQMGSGRANGP